MAQNLPNSVTEIKPEIQEAQRSQDKYKDLSYPIYAYDIQTAQKTHKEKIFKGAKQIIQAILNLKLHKQYHKKKKDKSWKEYLQIMYLIKYLYLEYVYYAAQQ